MKKPTTINWDEWRAEIESFSRQKAEEVPPGWLTTWQFAEGMRWSESHARKKIMDLLSTGKAERKKFNPEGLRKIWHYRLKK